MNTMENLKFYTKFKKIVCIVEIEHLAFVCMLFHYLIIFHDTYMNMMAGFAANESVSLVDLII